MNLAEAGGLRLIGFEDNRIMICLNNGKDDHVKQYDQEDVEEQ
jgi:hypothetical protein